MEEIGGHTSYMSIICQDVEKNFKWIYVCILSVPFLIAAILYLQSAFSKTSEISAPQIRLAVIFFVIALFCIILSIRIKGFRYHLLLDKVDGHFTYQKDNLLNTIHIKGQLSEIKEIFIRQSPFFSDSLAKMKQTLYKIGIRHAHREIVVYVSLNKDQAHQMASSLSSFIGVPAGNDGE